MALIIPPLLQDSPTYSWKTLDGTHLRANTPTNTIFLLLFISSSDLMPSTFSPSYTTSVLTSST
ncbi:hypothetical protein PIB30_089716 [Stylosanthes scabra]|uniref:Uncharacterized protein n=1 Tax=Stylosanthes scabra TaxID=79078 RepID=A0ABU6ZSQ4_9FABA|nr:hypothetical protein [Stylosanthes scabra]